MHRLLAMFIWISAAYAQTVLDGSDQKLDRGDAKAMKRAVLDALNSDTASFYSLSYQKTKDKENRNVICGIVSRAGEYAFYFNVAENAATLLPKQMGTGGRDLLIQQLGEIGCPLP
jgi:hypothetical protein